jgi:hypothetical protein
MSVCMSVYLTGCQVCILMFNLYLGLVGEIGKAKSSALSELVSSKNSYVEGASVDNVRSYEQYVRWLDQCDENELQKKIEELKEESELIAEKEKLLKYMVKFGNGTTNKVIIEDWITAIMEELQVAVIRKRKGNIAPVERPAVSNVIDAVFESSHNFDSYLTARPMSSIRSSDVDKHAESNRVVTALLPIQPPKIVAPSESNRVVTRRSPRINADDVVSIEKSDTLREHFETLTDEKTEEELKSNCDAIMKARHLAFDKNDKRAQQFLQGVEKVLMIGSNLNPNDYANVTMLNELRKPLTQPTASFIDIASTFIGKLMGAEIV